MVDPNAVAAGKVIVNEVQIDRRRDRSSRIALRVGIVGGVLSTAAATVSAAATDDKKAQPFTAADLIFFEIFIGGLLFTALCVAVPWFITRRKYMQNQNTHFAARLKAEQERHQQALEQLKQASELSTLMVVNQDQIKTYHDIVTEQADKSFKSSRLAMGVGMILLVAAAVAGAWVPFEQVRWFIGAIATLSTLLSGYLNRTYLALYKESIGQLNRYFDQPVLNGYHLTAERLACQLSESQQDEVRKQIITEILASGPHRTGVIPGPPSKPRKRTPKKQTASMNGTPQL
ncbi:hypothetical protein ABT052_05735 [Streptomyces sp. NPDC002766]|uniref:hypothetical protein n=1 Tax=Streptomyces sp. NPDC002766 TaxID=3154429 RepID=UPI003326CAA9